MNSFKITLIILVSIVYTNATNINNTIKEVLDKDIKKTLGDYND